MKSTFKFFTIAFIGLLMLFSCSKSNNENETDLNDDIVQSRSNTFTIDASGRVANEGGILSFPSITAFTSIREELVGKNQNQTFNDAAYLNLNIDSSLDEFVTENPINRVFENSLNFVSFRSVEDTRLETHMDLTGDPFDFDKELFLYDENTKTLFNSKKQIKIGKKYFQLYDDGALLVVGNNDLARFNQLAVLDHYNIETDLNVRVLDFEKGSKSYLFNFDSNNTRVDKDVIDLNIGIHEDANGKLSPINRSFVDFVNFSSVSYKWTFQDGTTQVIDKPVKEIFGGDVVKLELLSDGIPTGHKREVTVRSGPNDKCDHYIRALGINRCDMYVIIDIPWEDDVIGRVEWTLPNGQVRSGSKTQKGNRIRVNADNSDNGGPYVITVRLYDKDGSLICWQDHTIICDCGKTGKNKDEEESPVTINGDRWRVEVEIWCTDNGFVTSVGSQTRSMRKLSYGWRKRDVNSLFCSFSGTLVDGEIAFCPETVITYRDETRLKEGRLQVNIPESQHPKDPNYIENMNICESTHSFVKDGITVRYTRNGGKLFLN